LAIASPVISSGSADALATPAGRHNEGHGRRLTMAFEALESYPVLVESRNRVLRLFESGRPSISDVVGAVEADLALTVTVVRLANQLDGPTRGKIDSVVAGVDRAAARHHPRDRQPRPDVRLL
jgi:hypothetical protein